ncbi:hypothetical protein M1N79_00405 [Dehalococcoidia bacterium]|nr:hypothetical protein [Dehalococcoidia bacterium]
MIKEWLKNRITVEEAEQKHLVKDERLGPEPIPFGFQYEEWLAFKEQIQDGDELLEFSSPPRDMGAPVCTCRNMHCERQ